MSEDTTPVCPIFVRKYDNTVEQIGSGVLLKIKDLVFLLTAAHVSDWSEKGNLCIPSKNSIEEIKGYFASISVPKSLREKDKIDMSYYKLDDELVKNISDDFKPIGRNECWLTDNTIAGDIYTFSGYPLSKAKTIKNDTLYFEMYSYTGEAAISEKYKNLGYDSDANIIINFRTKKAIDSNGDKKMPPRPQGISGGAIFRFPKHIDEKPEHFYRSLVGIGHSYRSKDNCLIGTRLSLYYDFILRNNPNLAEEADISKNNGIPLFISLVCYKKEEWSLLISQFDDADNISGNWNQWRNTAEMTIEKMHIANQFVIPIELSAQEIMEYCQLNNTLNNTKSRIDLADKKLFNLLQEHKVI